MGIKLLFTFLTVNVNRCLFNLTLYNFDKMCLIALIYNKPAFVPNFVSSYCEMQIEGIQTSLPCFLLLAQFIVDTQIPIWVGLATCVLKWCHKGMKVHHTMKACTCSKGTPHYHRHTSAFFHELVILEGCIVFKGEHIVIRLL